MTLIANPQGCKVGWLIYDTEAEAIAAAKREEVARESKLDQGYDFGYLWPGTIKRYDRHPEYPEAGEVWVVVTT